MQTEWATIIDNNEATGEIEIELEEVHRSLQEGYIESSVRMMGLIINQFKTVRKSTKSAIDSLPSRGLLANPKDSSTDQ
jgi:hypothetical protein